MSKPAIVLIILGIVVIILGVVSYFYFFHSSDSPPSNFAISENPAEGLSDEEAIELFDESFIEYLLLSIKAYNLHKPPFSSDTPRIEFHVGGEIFNAEVLEYEFLVGRGEISDEDVVITTSKLEAIKMMRDVDYVGDSFRAGESSIELIAGEGTLFVKGYMKIYGELS